MKNEKKLSKAVQLLQSELPYVALDHTKDTIAVVVNLLNEFAIDNVSVTNSSRKLIDFRAMDDFRPVLCGIYHDKENKVAVATNGKYMAVSKDDYNPDFAGKIIDQYGEEIEGKYPNYLLVMKEPREYINHPSHMMELLPVARCKEVVKQMKAYTKINGKKSADHPMVRIGDTWFNAERLLDINAYMGECRAFTISGGDRTYLINDDGKECLLVGMNVNYESDEDENEAKRHRAMFVDSSEVKHYID